VLTDPAHRLAGQSRCLGFEQPGTLCRGAAVDQQGAVGGVDDAEVGVEAVVGVGPAADFADEGKDAGLHGVDLQGRWLAGRGVRQDGGEGQGGGEAADECVHLDK